MSWNPKINVIDLTQVAANIFAFIQANQTDALFWANGGAGLADIAKFYKSEPGRIITTFPCLMLLTKEMAEDMGDTPAAKVELTFELALSGANTDELVERSVRYDLAVRSMLANIPEMTLTANSKTDAKAYIDSLQSRYAIAGGTASAFIDAIRIIATYDLTGQLLEN